MPAIDGGEADRLPLERMWYRPTLELNGIWGGYTGAGGKTIVPTDAHAKISFRLVAAQEPAEVSAAVRAWLEDGLPPGVTCPAEDCNYRFGVIRVLSGQDCSLQQNLGGVDLDGDGKIEWARS